MSIHMLHYAKSRCPEARFIRANITEVDFQGSFDGIVAWDSLFHIPRARHQALYVSFCRWLKPGAPVLLSAGGSEGEFTAPMFDVDFFYSSHALDENRRLLEACGFDMILAEVDDRSSRGHVTIIAKKTG